MGAGLLSPADDVHVVDEDAVGGVTRAGRHDHNGECHGTYQDGGTEATEHRELPFVGRTPGTSGSDAWLAGREEPDAELVRRYQSGDVDAFTCLYQRHNAAVRDVCRGRLRDSSLAEDAVQETFARALTALPGFADGELFAHWLKRVAVNHCKDVLRRHERRNVPLDAKVATLTDVGSESEVLRCIQREAVAGVLRELSQRDAALLVAHHVDGDPLAVLAQRWGQTAGSMKVTLHRARARFRDVSAGMLGLAPLGSLRRWWRHSLSNLRHIDGGVATAASGIPTAALQIVVAMTLSVGSPALAATLSEAVRPAASTTAVASAGGAVSSVKILSEEDGFRRTEGAGRSASASRHANDRGERDDSRAGRSAPPVKVEPVLIPVMDQRVEQAPTTRPEYEYGAKVEAGPVDRAVGVERHPGSRTAAAHDTACDLANSVPAATYCTR